MTDKQLGGWNHLPEVPIRVSPFFTWPLDPLAMVKWVVGSWLLITEKLIVLGISIACLVWFSPTMEQTRALSLDWIAGIYLRNFLLIFAVAGILHLWFYTFSKQGQKLRYDSRPLRVKGRQFTLGGQVRDNMFWTLGSGVFFWTGYEVLMLWGLANGYVPWLSWAANPVWFVALFLLTPLWESFYFYWIHRLIHVPWIYEHVHALHHRNVSNTYFRAGDVERGAYHRLLRTYLEERYPKPVQCDVIESVQGLALVERFIELPSALRPDEPCTLVRAFTALAEQHPPLRDYVALHWRDRYSQCIPTGSRVP